MLHVMGQHICLTNVTCFYVFRSSTVLGNCNHHPNPEAVNINLLGRERFTFKNFSGSLLYWVMNINVGETYKVMETWVVVCAKKIEYTK